MVETSLTKTGFRVLYTLSNSLGTPLPISVLTAGVKEDFGTGHYKNVHQAVEKLTEAGYLRVERTGGSKLVSLNLSANRTVDLLAEVDLRARRGTQEGIATLPTASSRMSDLLQREPSVSTAFLVDAETNRTLNRLELVVAARGKGTRRYNLGAPLNDPARLPDFSRIHELIEEEARTANVRIDSLFLTEPELMQGLASRKLHPIQAQTSRRTTLLDPQRFWWLVREAQRQGPEPKMRESPAGSEAPLDLVSKVGEATGDLGPHLRRFGYSEMGGSGAVEDEVCLELVLAAALGSEKPRHRYATAVLLSKNDVNPRLMAFLAKKHDLSADLLGIVDALGDRARSEDLAQLRDFLPSGVEPADVDDAQVDEMLDLYGTAR